MHALYIDDLSEAEAVELKKQLVQSPHPRHRPLQYRERTHHYFPPQNSLLQRNLNKIENFTKENLMKINTKKTNIMLFNRSKMYDFLPEFSLSDGNILEVVEETKLLGVILQSNLSWKKNTEYLVKRAMTRMWLLRRMKSLGLEPDFILEYYVKEIRPVVEHGVPVWHGGLTTQQSTNLERIQKVALKVILGDCYKSYEHARSIFSLDPLDERREQLCTIFAVKTFLSKRRRQFFYPPEKTKITRNSQNILVKENFTRTKIAYNAPHNYLARLVNRNSLTIRKKLAPET